MRSPLSRFSSPSGNPVTQDRRIRKAVLVGIPAWEDQVWLRLHEISLTYLGMLCNFTVEKSFTGILTVTLKVIENIGDISVQIDLKKE